jgi:hypothetical protein
MKRWLRIGFYVLIGVALGIIALTQIPCQDRTIEFKGCETEVMRCYLKETTYHCGEDFWNHNAHIRMLQCLCQKLEGAELEDAIESYLSRYAPDFMDMVEEGLESNMRYIKHIEELHPGEMKEHLGYNHTEKPPICFLHEVGCF